MTADRGPSVPTIGDRGRRLLRLADTRGIIVGIAIDHRDSFRATLAGRGIQDCTDDDLREIKLRLARALAPAATAIMLDEELGGRAIDEGAVPSSAGLIMPLEAQGDDQTGDERLTTLMTSFTPEDAHARGAAACKVLVPYRPDVPSTAAKQDDLIRAAIGASHRAGLPLVVEPVVYRRSMEDVAAFGEAYPSLVVAATARIAALGPDLLKLPFPVGEAAPPTSAEAQAASRRLDDATRGVPWVLLGGGVDAETFLDQVQVAGAAGASGFLAGRGIWGPALHRDPDVVERRAVAIARPLLERCRLAVERVARPLPDAA